MPERAVLVIIGRNYISIPFSNIDEIIGFEKVLTRQELPEGMVLDDSQSQYWVAARDEWLPLNFLVPGPEVTETSQVVITDQNGTARAVYVDNVLGMEDMKPVISLPEVVYSCCGFPLAGARVWKEKIVLELDLSRLI